MKPADIKELTVAMQRKNAHSYRTGARSERNRIVSILRARWLELQDQVTNGPAALAGPLQARIEELKELERKIMEGVE